MINMFDYDFMRRAFLSGMLIAVIIPCIGTVVVLKRLSMIGDALSHTSLAGVAAGLIAGINPTVGAAAASVAAALSIEAIRKRIPRFSEMSIAIVMSAGIGLAAVLSGFVTSSANFNRYLFGSIIAIDDDELFLIIGVSISVLTAFILLYKQLFFVAMDERAARLAGVPVKTINFIFTILTAATVSVGARTVGALIISSLMVVPVACAMQLSKSYFQTVIFSVLFALLFTATGLTLSFYLSLKPGGTIILVGVLCLIVVLFIKKLAAYITARKTKEVNSVD